MQPCISSIVIVDGNRIDVTDRGAAPRSSTNGAEIDIDVRGKS